MRDVMETSPDRGARHHVLNDVVARAFALAGFPVSNEPAGLSRVDGKRPDGMTLISWQAGKLVVWDVTVICTTADSYVEASARESGAAAEIAATCKRPSIPIYRHSTPCSVMHACCVWYNTKLSAVLYASAPTGYCV